VIRSFGDRATEDVFHGRETRLARSLPKALWPVIRRKLDALNAAHTLDDVRCPPGNRLERLKGTGSRSYSIRVNDQYRITFAFVGGDATDVRCEDYH
jgi:proteic killer suppression protein